MRNRGLNRPIAQSNVSGDVGLELEIEGVDLLRDRDIENIVSPETAAHWQTTHDGSLRNGGLEYVLTKPIKTSEIRHMVGSLFDRMATYGSIVQNTNRCSTHVHVNAAGLKINHVTSVLALWSTFGHAFIRWCGEERTHNHFCLSVQDEDSLLEAWESYLVTGDEPTGQGLKYTALNILPLWTLGSLEFRCGSAPDEADKVVHWAKMCNAIVRYAADHFSNPMDIAYALSEQGPRELLRSILVSANLGPHTTDRIFRELTNEINFDKISMDCFRDCQHLVMGYNWHQLLDKIEAPFVPNPFAAERRF